MVHINYRSPLPLYEQIKEGIIKLLMTGALAPEERLPSVRDLATELAINPNTIQRAYRELESEGYIYTVPGRGCFAAAQAEAKADTAPLLAAFRDSAAKLIFNGVSCETLRQELDTIDKEVTHHD